MIKYEIQKKQKAFRMRLEKRTLEEISKAVGVCTVTLMKWENGWTNSKGRRFDGWKKQLEKLWHEQEQEEMKTGLMVKKERIKAYDKLARMAIEKITASFPNITTKNSSDIKALLSEVRELCRLIAIEKGEYQSGNQNIVAVKTDICLPELKTRYIDVKCNSEDESN